MPEKGSLLSVPETSLWLSIPSLQTHMESSMSVDAFIKPQTKVLGYLAGLLQPLQAGGKLQDAQRNVFLHSCFFDILMRKGAFRRTIWTCNKQCSTESTSLFMCSNQEGVAMALCRCSALAMLSTNSKHTFQKAHPPAVCSCFAQRRCPDQKFFVFKHFCTRIIFACVRSQARAWSTYLKLVT